jgi:hypothetical protein
MSGSTTSNWVARAREALSTEERAHLLAEILEATSQDLGALEKLARANECHSTLRRAAVDQYAQLAKHGALALLRELSDFRKERSEDVRVAAFVWRSSLETGGTGQGTTSVRVRGAVRSGAGWQKESWRLEAASDPSARVQWLANLGVKEA